MEPFKLPGKDTRLIIHNKTVYKIKLVYGTRGRDSNRQTLPCDVSSMHHEIEEAVRVILAGNQSPLKTDHFIIHTDRKPWKMASLLIFTEHGKRLNTHPSMLTLLVLAREDLGSQLPEHQPQSLQAEQRSKSVPQKEQDHELAHQSSLTSGDGTRKHTRCYTVKENPEFSPPPVKKPKSPDKSNTRDQSSIHHGTGHRHYLLRRRVKVPAKEQQHTVGTYHLRSQDLEAAQDKVHQQRDKSSLRARSHRESTASNEARPRQGTQENIRDASQLHEAEPRVGATAGAESRPAYPRGGVVQADVCRQPGRRDGQADQLNEQMRLQRLAGNPQTGPPAMAHYQLRPRGALEQIISSVLTPVKKLFS